MSLERVILCGMILLLACCITFFFCRRMLLAFDIVITLMLTLVAFPLPIASPFSEGVNADLPLYEVLTPILGLCVLVKMAAGKARVPSNGLSKLLFMWFLLVVVTYCRHPVFLGDLFAAGGTGAIYHTLYPLCLCALIFLCTACILNTRARIVHATKLVCVVMILGLGVMTFMLLTGIDVPLLTGGRGPWTVMQIPTGNETVYRSIAMSTYGADLYLALMCFGYRLSKVWQGTLGALLVVPTVIGGGRTAVITLIIYIVLGLWLRLRSARIVFHTVAAMVAITALALCVGMRVPRTATRVTDFSTDSRVGIGGRMEMFMMAIQPIMDRPFMGYGYGGLWTARGNQEISNQVASGNAHAGVLAVMLCYGLVGLGTFLSCLTAAIWMARQLYQRVQDAFLRDLMLWIALHLAGLFVVFFLSVEVEKYRLVYLDMGVICVVCGLCAQTSAARPLLSCGPAWRQLHGTR